MIWELLISELSSGLTGSGSSLFDFEITCSCAPLWEEALADLRASPDRKDRDQVGERAVPAVPEVAQSQAPEVELRGKLRLL